MATNQTEAGGKTGRQRRKIKNLLINKKFQLKYTLIVVVLAVIIATILGILVYREATQSTEMLKNDIVKQLGTERGKHLLADVEAGDRRTAMYLFLFLGILVVCLMGLGIYVTHKVAGPLFKMSKYLQEIAKGKLCNTYPLRKGDDLQEFYETFQGMMNYLRSKEESENGQISEVIAKVDGQINSGKLSEEQIATFKEVQERLTNLRASKQECLE